VSDTNHHSIELHLADSYTAKSDARNMKPLRIAIVNQPWLSSLPVPTSSLEIWTYEVSRRLAKDNDVHIFGGLPARSLRNQRFRDQGVTYHLTSTTPDAFAKRLLPKIRRSRQANRPDVARQSYYFFWAARVAWELRRLKPDIIHIQNQFPFARIIGRLNPHAKIILHMHSEWLSQIDHREVQPSLNRVSAVMACSARVLAEFEGRSNGPPLPTAVVPNGVDPDAFSATAAGGSGCSRSRIVFVGRISPEKGCHSLVDAFASIAAQDPEVTLTMVGPVGALPVGHIVELGKDRHVRDLKRFYTTSISYPDQILGSLPREIRSRVSITGGLSRERVAEEIRDATVLVNPSLSETFGMSLVEAMSSAVPTIATTVGGMPEIVQDGITGSLVPPEDPTVLAEAIQDLLSNAEKRRAMGAAGRERVLRHYTWEVVADTILEVYGSLVPQGAPYEVGGPIDGSPVRAK